MLIVLFATSPTVFRKASSLICYIRLCSCRLPHFQNDVHVQAKLACERPLCLLMLAAEIYSRVMYTILRPYSNGRERRVSLHAILSNES